MITPLKGCGGYIHTSVSSVAIQVHTSVMGMGKSGAFQGMVPVLIVFVRYFPTGMNSVSMYISNTYLPWIPKSHHAQQLLRPDGCKQCQCLENKGERVDITQLCNRDERVSTIWVRIANKRHESGHWSYSMPYQTLVFKVSRELISCPRGQTWSSGHLMQLVGVVGCTSFGTVGVQEEVYFQFNSINPRPEGFLCFSRTHGGRKKTGGITLTLSPRKFKILVSGLESCQTRSGLCLEMSQIHACIREG